MPTFHHPQLAQGAWKNHSFIDQMANVGSEVERCIKWRERKKENLAQQAFIRAIELLNLTISSNLSDTPRLKELLRVRECLYDSFAFNNEYRSTTASWHSYFRAFNYAARMKKNR